MDKYSSAVSYFGGGICTLLGVLSLNEIAIVIGIILLVATFLINWIYKRRDFQHKKALREIYYEKHYKNHDDSHL